MSSSISDTYWLNVIKAWDDASEHFKNAAINANKRSLINQLWLLKGNRLLAPEGATITQTPSKAGYELQTDGVGTKVRIYMRAFNGLYEQYRVGKDAHKKEQLEAVARDLFYRMFLDLYAMNVDDFRHGDIALAVSDILDIDHITLTGEDAEQGKIFCTAFAHAIGRVIETTKIACVAGETAILGDGEKLKDTRNNLWGVVDWILSLKDTDAKVGEALGWLPGNVECLILEMRAVLKKALAAKEKQSMIDRSVELNLGWSTTGFRNGDKLIPLEGNQVVIALFEKKTEKGIISPRANGISAIRNSMEKLLGEDWPLKTLQAYFDMIAEKWISIDQPVKDRLSLMWLETPLWDIATGETTVFNPLVGGVLLGGVENWPLFPNSIAGQIHVTGNPVGKWSDIVADSGLGIEVDYSGIQIPQIIEMCMIAEQQNFSDGMKKFNMGIPYALVCSEDQVRNVLDTIWVEWFDAKKVGKIITPWQWEQPVIRISYDGGSFEAGIASIR